MARRVPSRNSCIRPGSHAMPRSPCSDFPAGRLNATSVRSHSRSRRASSFSATVSGRQGPATWEHTFLIVKRIYPYTITDPAAPRTTNTWEGSAFKACGIGSPHPPDRAQAAPPLANSLHHSTIAAFRRQRSERACEIPPTCVPSMRCLDLAPKRRRCCERPLLPPSPA